MYGFVVLSLITWRVNIRIGIYFVYCFSIVQL